MRVLQLTVHFKPNVGGVETHLADLVDVLAKKGNQVFVLAYRPLQTRTDWRVYEKRRHASVFRIPWIPGFFYTLVKSPMLEFLYLFPALFVVAGFVIPAFSPQVIHAHGLIAGAVGVFWGRVFRKRVVISLHSIYHFPQKGFYKKFVELILGNADAVLGLSRQSVGEIERIMKDKDRVGVFTYWVDLRQFRRISGAKRKLGWQGRFVVLFVGRLVEEKGLFPLLSSFKKWSEKMDLAVVGGGPLEDKVKGVASRSNNLIFMGEVRNEDLPLYYSAADLLIVPSVHEEGFGRVILEALACGTPVIGARRGAIPEAMDESVGKLIDVTPENIKSAVEYFYKSPGKLKMLSSNARKVARTHYSEKNVKGITSFYK